MLIPASGPLRSFDSRRIAPTPCDGGLEATLVRHPTSAVERQGEDVVLGFVHENCQLGHLGPELVFLSASSWAGGGAVPMHSRSESHLCQVAPDVLGRGGLQTLGRSEITTPLASAGTRSRRGDACARTGRDEPRSPRPTTQLHTRLRRATDRASRPYLMDVLAVNSTTKSLNFPALVRGSSSK